MLLGKTCLEIDIQSNPYLYISLYLCHELEATKIALILSRVEKKGFCSDFHDGYMIEIYWMVTFDGFRIHSAGK